MKKVFFTLTMMAGVFVFTSCSQKAKEAIVEEIRAITENEEAGIIKNSVTDKSGNTMYLTFNNPQKIVDIILKDDTITLVQDTTASGIKFTNAQYVYEERQGKITLEKDGNVVFEK